MPELDAVQSHLEPLSESAAGLEVPGDRAIDRARWWLEVTGAPPRALRLLRTDAGLIAFLTLGLDGASTLAGGARARERDRGADPQRGCPRSPSVIVHTEPAGAPDYADRMRLCMFSPKGMELERGWPGRVEGDRVVQLAAQTLQAFFTGGGGAREHAEFPLADCDLLAPVLYPPSVRVFSPFERLAEPWFSFASPFPVLGPGAEVAWPDGERRARVRARRRRSRRRTGGDRRLHARQLLDARATWLAPSGRRDSDRPRAATSASRSGPLLVTADEFEGGWLAAGSTARSAAASTSAGSPIPGRRSASAPRAGTRLRPGDLLIARAPLADGEPLAPGDLVELECEGIGTLAGRVAPGAPARRTGRPGGRLSVRVARRPVR